MSSHWEAVSTAPTARIHVIGRHGSKFKVRQFGRNYIRTLDQLKADVAAVREVDGVVTSDIGRLPF